MKDPIVKASSMGTRGELTAQCLQKAKENFVQRCKRYIQSLFNKFRSKESTKTEIKVCVNAAGRFGLTTTTDKKQNKFIVLLDLPKEFELEKFEHSDQNTVVEANFTIDDCVKKYSRQHEDVIRCLKEILPKHSNEHGTTDNGKDRLDDVIRCLKENFSKYSNEHGTTDNGKDRIEEDVIRCLKEILPKHSNEHGTTDNGKDGLGEALTSFNLTHSQNINTQTADQKGIEKKTVSKLQRQLKTSGMKFDHDIVAKETNMKENNALSLLTEKTAEEFISEIYVSYHDSKALCTARMSNEDIVEKCKTVYPHKTEDIVFYNEDEMKTKSNDQQLPDRIFFSSEEKNIAVYKTLTQSLLQVTNNGINEHLADELTNNERTYESAVTSMEIPSKVQADETVASKEMQSIETRTDLNESYSEEHHDKPTSLQSQPELHQELRKMKLSKQRTRSTYRPQKLNAYAHLVETETHEYISEVLRQLVDIFFQNGLKRPHVTWPSMHPMLPVKVRYLDTSSTERVNIKTTSSPPSSVSSDGNDSDDSDTEERV